jgi:ribosomal protein S18 acetylase RimI-like enzyme
MANDTLSIRQATINDLPILYNFEQGVITAERPFDDTLKPDPVTYYDLEQMIASPDVEIVVGELNGAIIACGYARITLAKHFIKHTHHAYLGFMYVVPEHRGQGFNKKIIEHLTAWAHAKGLTELRLEVYAGNSSAIKAYEKIGFTPYIVEMRLE